MDLTLKRDPGFDIDNFPVRMTIQKNRSILVSMHWHEELEFIRVLSGPVLIILDSRKFEANTGDIVFIENNCTHFVQCIGMSDKAIQGLVFDKKIFEETMIELGVVVTYASFIDAGIFLFDAHHKINSFLNTCMEQLYMEYIGQDKFYKMAIKGTIYNMMSLLLRHYTTFIEQDSSLQEKVAKLNRLQPVFSYIEHYYTTPITLDSLCKEVNMSAYYFSRFFKDVVGSTPINYVIQYRIRMAIRLLSNSDSSIALIAEQVGFATINYFDKAFKSEYNLSPSEYRKAITASTTIV